MIFSVFMNDNIDITQKEAPHKDSFLEERELDLNQRHRGYEPRALAN